jgi:hypothetical protein
LELIGAVVIVKDFLSEDSEQGPMEELVEEDELQ